jgi:hypothetical protein
MRRLGSTLVIAAALFVQSLSLRAQSIGKIEGSDSMVGVRNVQVPPVLRTDVANMVDAGTIDTEGFAHLTVNLAAELKGPATRQGSVVAILMPDVAPFDYAFETLGLLPASLEFAGNASPNGGLYLMAKQATLDVGFPRYRVMIYNTTGSTATVVFFAYRSRH